MTIDQKAVAEAISAVLGQPRAPGRWTVVTGASIWLSDENGTPRIGMSTAPWVRPSQWESIRTRQDLEQCIDRIRSLALKSVLGP